MSDSSKVKKLESIGNSEFIPEGIKKTLFEPSALVAIQQGSEGSLRRANQLASGDLVAAATEQSNIVTADHIRTAAATAHSRRPTQLTLCRAFWLLNQILVH